jgi:hypothetical protein
LAIYRKNLRILQMAEPADGLRRDFIDPGTFVEASRCSRCEMASGCGPGVRADRPERFVQYRYETVEWVWRNGDSSGEPFKGGRESFQVIPNFIPHSAKEDEALVFRALKGCGILKRFVNAFGVTGKHRAALLCMVADREHVIEGLALKIIHVLRTMIGNINAELFHNRNRFGSHAPRFCASAFNFEAVSGIMLEQAFRHLAAGGVSRTEN